MKIFSGKAKVVYDGLELQCQIVYIKNILINKENLEWKITFVFSDRDPAYVRNHLMQSRKLMVIEFTDGRKLKMFAEPTNVHVVSHSGLLEAEWRGYGKLSVKPLDDLSQLVTELETDNAG